MLKKKSPYTKSQLNAVLRNDFASFAQKAFHLLHPGQDVTTNWLFDCLTYHLQRCVTGDIKRLIICVPPRHLKSFLSTVTLPAWILGRDPTRKLICVSYNQDLATKFHQDCHEIIESDFYQETFPGMHLANKPNTNQEYATKKKGFRLATSVGGTFTGRGADYIIIDDPMKASEAYSDAERKKLNLWFSDTAASRLDNHTEGRIIIVTQRVHVDDLVAHVRELGDWTIVSVPAIAEVTEEYNIGPDETYVREMGTVIDPNRQSLEELLAIKKALTPVFFAAQYQQDPVVLGGDLIKFDYFQRLCPPATFDFTAQVWDTASKAGETNDYSVCMTFGVVGHKYYILDVFRDRLEYVDLRSAAVHLINKWHPDIVLIEDTGVGSSLLSELPTCGYRYALGYNPTENKIVRVMEQLNKLAEGRMILPLDASWIKPLREEVVQFPNGKYDDQVDVIEAFLRRVDHMRNQVARWGNDKVFNSFSDGERPGIPQLTCRVINVGSDGIVDRYAERTGTPLW